MVALTAARNTLRRENGELEGHPAKAGVTFHTGALACLDAAGWAVPGATAVGLKPLGRVEGYRKPGAANGDEIVPIRRGTFRFANLGADVITRADIGNQAWIVDDQTVARTNGGNTRSAAGIIRDVDAQGVWVQF
jgi:hypothetical protein